MNHGSNVIPIDRNVEKAGSNRHNTGRKKRSPNEVRNISVTEMFGNFLRLLRKRISKTGEELARNLNYRGPTQIIRREAGLLNVPISEAQTLAYELKCDLKLFLILRMAAFESLNYQYFGEAIILQFNQEKFVDPVFLFRQEIEALEFEIENLRGANSQSIWLGANRSSGNILLHPR